jgi:hypothetical protein
VEVDAAGDGDGDQNADLQAGDRERDEQIPEHEQAPRDGRGEQLALGAALPVDDYPERLIRLTRKWVLGGAFGQRDF